jgi:hypothetical protein
MARARIVQYVRGEFAAAAESFAKAQPIAPDAGELAGSTDWLWMSLGRAGRGADAKAMLDRRPDSHSQPATNAYTRRLQLYRGEIGPDAILTPGEVLCGYRFPAPGVRAGGGGVGYVIRSLFRVVVMSLVSHWFLFVLT